MKQYANIALLTLAAVAVSPIRAGAADYDPTCKCQVKETSLIRAAFGGGLSRLGDDHEDFKVEDGHIYIENDSRFRSEFQAGILLMLKDFENDRNLNLVLNASLTQGGAQILDGVFVGLGFQFMPAIVFFAGYSRHPGKELSPGYQRAMGRYLQGEYPKEKYGHIKLEHGEIAHMSDYDGLPAKIDFFQGDPITKSYNSKISFGVLIPVDFWKEIKKQLGAK